jgi:hypothetical protein
VNILRPATLILVVLVSHRDPSNPLAPQIPSLAGVVAQQPNLAQVLVGRLTAADYTLCSNSLMLINAISRDAMKSDFKEWTRYVRIIYSYGANRNVSVPSFLNIFNVGIDVFYAITRNNSSNSRFSESCEIVGQEMA